MHRLMFPGALALALTGMSTADAVTPQQPDGAKLLRDIERLSAVGHVLYVAAHPDDENTRLLAWLVANQHVRAAYLSLTRGEGGQNLLGSEQAPLLGLIRTQELLAARGIDGAEQLFGNERDFGYSKTPEETLSIWGHQEALGDVVWAIRKFQPDVIVTRFSPEDRETHGHHTASAMLAVEAFTAAADPHAFPEQLTVVAPWQAKRIVWNKGVFGQAKPGSLDGFLKMDIGGFDPLLGTAAGEVAARSRSMHKSQGFGQSPQRGPALEYFRVLLGEPMQNTFLDGIDLTWGRVAGAENLRNLLENARVQFDVQNPAASIPILQRAADALEVLPDNPFKAEKRAEIAAAIAACAGLFVDAVAARPGVNPGGETKVTVTAINRAGTAWSLHSVRLLGDEAVVDKLMNVNEPVTVERAVTLPATAPLSNPYWLVNEPSAGRWTVTDLSVAALPEQRPPVEAVLSFSAGGHTLEVTRPVIYTWNDPVVGERRRPLEVLPPATVNPAEPLLVFPDGAAKEVHLTVRAHKAGVAGTISPQVASGFTVTPASLPFDLKEAGAEAALTFRIHPPSLGKDGQPQSAMLKLTGTLADRTPVDRSLRRIEYQHIPVQTLTPRAEVKLVRLDLKRAVSRVGYIPGAGDEVVASLRQAGYDVTVLSDEALAKGPLGGYQAIVVGVRAFNTNDRLPRYHDRLMDFVRSGGTLVVQYNTQNRISSIVGPIGPWPFNISQDRVTNEDAAVELLDPHNAIFQRPNRIGTNDFSGWVQERGLYFADTWDPQYTALMSMNDKGEKAKKGSLLVGHYGKGLFVYTGLAFFRQLPAGVPGAYRLFANLLSHGR